MGKRSVFHKSIKGRMAGRYRLRKVRNPRPASTSTRVSIITAIKKRVKSSTTTWCQRVGRGFLTS